MKHLFTTIALLFILVAIHAQEVRYQHPKLDLQTLRTINDPKFPRDQLNLFVKGELTDIQEAAEQANGIYKYGYGTYAAVRIPLNDLYTFLDNEAVQYVENGDIPIVPLSDSAIVTNNILPVHAGQLPSGISYTGKNVVMGVVDEGIFYTHLDFRNPSDSSTRIRFFWDQDAATFNAPVPYGFGEELTEIDINTFNVGNREITNVFSHGTHVTGVAAGNGLATGDFTGMAPEADLVIVRIDLLNSGYEQFLSDFIDGVDYIFKKADAMGKPCVVNASVGTYVGSRDGKEISAQLIDAMLEERNGRVLVCAAGNAGQFDFHVGYEVTADTNFNWFKFNPFGGGGNVFFELWADTADFRDVQFTIGGNDPLTNYEDLGRIDFMNIVDDFGVTEDGINSILKDFDLIYNNTKVADIFIRATVNEGRYKVEVEVNPSGNNTNLWRLETIGSGRFDVWSSQMLMGTSDIVPASELPDSSIYPRVVYYQAPDDYSSIVASFTASDKVITVGNYVNKNTYENCAGDTVVNTNVTPVGSLYENTNPAATPSDLLGSSHGPARDGRIKPDISATGAVVAGTGNANHIALLNGSGDPNNINKVVEGCQHFINTGTSISSPVVAGAAALYLEMKPNASFREVKDAIILTAKRDAFTGPTENNDYGYGKLDALAMMQAPLVFGCTDVTAFNYDAASNSDDGSCIPVIMGCMDTAALNYDSTANTVGDTCIYRQVGIAIVNGIEFEVSLFPNPSQGAFTVNYSLSAAMLNQSKLVIVDMLGRTVKELELNGNSGQQTFELKTSGVYLSQLQYKDRMIFSDKLVVY